jgi:hypothetical protein
MSSNGATEGEGGDDSGRSYSTEPNQKKRPIGRKQAKERLKSGGDAGPYKEAIEELILDKEEKKLEGNQVRGEKTEGGQVEGGKDDSPGKDIIGKGKIDVGTRTENHVL